MALWFNGRTGKQVEAERQPGPEWWSESVPGSFQAAKQALSYPTGSTGVIDPGYQGRYDSYQQAALGGSFAPTATPASVLVSLGNQGVDAATAYDQLAQQFGTAAADQAFSERGMASPGDVTDVQFQPDRSIGYQGADFLPLTTPNDPLAQAPTAGGPQFIGGARGASGDYATAPTATTAADMSITPENALNYSSEQLAALPNDVLGPILDRLVAERGSGVLLDFPSSRLATFPAEYQNLFIQALQGNPDPRAQAVIGDLSGVIQQGGGTPFAPPAPTAAAAPAAAAPAAAPAPAPAGNPDPFGVAPQQAMRLQPFAFNRAPTAGVTPTELYTSLVGSNVGAAPTAVAGRSRLMDANTPLPPGVAGPVAGEPPTQGGGEQGGRKFITVYPKDMYGNPDMSKPPIRVPIEEQTIDLGNGRQDTGYYNPTTAAWISYGESQTRAGGGGQPPASMQIIVPGSLGASQAGALDARAALDLAKAQSGLYDAQAIATLGNLDIARRAQAWNEQYQQAQLELDKAIKTGSLALQQQAQDQLNALNNAKLKLDAELGYAASARADMTANQAAAGLTGYYGGAPTLQREQAAAQNALNNAQTQMQNALNAATIALKQGDQAEAQRQYDISQQWKQQMDSANLRLQEKSLDTQTAQANATRAEQARQFDATTGLASQQQTWNQGFQERQYQQQLRQAPASVVEQLYAGRGQAAPTSFGPAPTANAITGQGFAQSAPTGLASGQNAITAGEVMNSDATPLGIRRALGGESPGAYSSGVPLLSNQRLNQLTGTERTALGSIVQATGQNSADYFEQGQQLGAAPTGQRQFAYRAPTARVAA